MQLLRETNIGKLNGQVFDRFETHKIILTTDELKVIKKALDMYEDEIIVYGDNTGKEKKLQDTIEEITLSLETYLIDERIDFE